MKYNVVFTHPDAHIEKAHAEDVNRPNFCYDLYAVSEEEVAPNVWKYGLGIKIQRDEETNDEAFTFGVTIRPRSSIWKTGMVLSNSIGTVDDNYTGEISVVFYHVMPNMPRYKVGDKICQIHTDLTTNMEFVEVKQLEKTQRGENGYGSTNSHIAH